jgi:hypothetical protein
VAEQRGQSCRATDLSGTWIDRVHARKPQTTIVLDMDSSVSETHGAQEGRAYNGHFGCTCYHPLFVFNQFGDLERCALRPGLSTIPGAMLLNASSPYRRTGVLHTNLQRYFGKDGARARAGLARHNGRDEPVDRPGDHCRGVRGRSSERGGGVRRRVSR